MSYNRYKKFTNDGNIAIVPFVEIVEKSSDKYHVYKSSRDRLDILSYRYYEDPNYGWLIMQANPQYGSMEFNIPDGSSLRIPFPLDLTLQGYIEGIDNYNKLN